MSIFQKIWNLFLSSDKPLGRTHASDEGRKRFEKKFYDLGNFIYEEDGFILQSIREEQRIKWKDIERLTAYKQDLFTIDEICLDIVYNNWQTTITEETPGWYQFIEKIKLVFPSIPANWDSEIVQPPFATNFRILYQRADREMPEENNFYASFRFIPISSIKTLFEQHDWVIRKASSTEFELHNSWTELLLQESNAELLLSGRVAFHPDNITILETLFNTLGGEYVFEFYDNDKNLLLEKKSGG